MIKTNLNQDRDEKSKEVLNKVQLVWPKLIRIVVLHVFAMYGLYLTISAKLLTLFFLFILIHLSGFGVMVFVRFQIDLN